PPITTLFTYTTLFRSKAVGITTNAFHPPYPTFNTSLILSYPMKKPPQSNVKPAFLLYWNWNKDSGFASLVFENNELMSGDNLGAPPIPPACPEIILSHAAIQS